MRFKEFYLIESLGTVYHTTAFRNLLEILKKDEIKLSPNMSEFELKTGDKGYYFLSTMRNKSGKFFNNHATQAYFELDVDKLKQHSPSKPVNFYQNDRTQSEEEERFWFKDDAIINIKKYIKKIHILIKPEYNEDKNKFILDNIKKIKYLASTLDIPVKFYDNETNFRTGKKDISFEGNEYTRSITHDTKERQYVEIRSVVKFMNGEKMSKREKGSIENLTYRAYENDFIRSVLNLLQFARKDKDEFDDSEIWLKRFVELLKKYKYKNPDTFLREIVKPKVLKAFPR